MFRYSSRMSTCSDPDRPDTDDETSQRSYSNASSPSASLQPTPNYVSFYWSIFIISYSTFLLLGRFYPPVEDRSLPCRTLPSHSRELSRAGEVLQPPTILQPAWLGYCSPPGTCQPLLQECHPTWNKSPVHLQQIIIERKNNLDDVKGSNWGA